ncbi:histone-lysine N-methyltransferase ASHR1 isoform X2 [Cryptomeria japonica]|uniref:histone-lysine N-methyltransferase ASHR1 isoform X2 n=1 Tax=Cryptomeria japonica TaxID=3369 RepID=UPI0027DA775B|nr:histone-lysine N-methyltransferase ASHR1 isoform X2 [Cryptomeria japonica]
MHVFKLNATLVLWQARVFLLFKTCNGFSWSFDCCLSRCLTWIMEAFILTADFSAYPPWIGNIKAGEVVVAERAVAFMPRAHYHSAICHSCCCDFVKNSDGVKCSSCQNVVHCKTCEEKALPQHRKWCSVYKEINRIAKESDCDQDLVHFVLSLFSKKYSDPGNNRKVVGVESINVGGKVEDGIINSCFQDALGLQTHQSKMPKAWRNSVQKACQALQIVIMNECEGDLDCSVGELEWLAALVNTNAHGMGAQGLRNTDVALGIFPFVSMLNHSCRPNCCFASEGNVMFVRAIQDISTDNELCVSYINLYEPRSTRKHELSVTKHFDCNCQRCMEPLESSLDRFLEGCMCNVKGCDGLLLKRSSLDGHVSGDGELTPWICDTCSRVLDPMSFDAEGKQIAETPWVLVGKAEEQMAIAMSACRERHLKDARALLEKFNVDFSGKLHHLHVLLFDSLTPLMNCHRAVGDAEGGVRVCRRILSCLEKVLPNSSLELANFYFCLGEMCFERAEASDISPVLAKHFKKQAHEAFQHVRQIRKICLGKSDLPN